MPCCRHSNPNYHRSGFSDSDANYESTDTRSNLGPDY